MFLIGLNSTSEIVYIMFKILSDIAWIRNNKRTIFAFHTIVFPIAILFYFVCVVWPVFPWWWPYARASWLPRPGLQSIPKPTVNMQEWECEWERQRDRERETWRERKRDTERGRDREYTWCMLGWTGIKGKVVLSTFAFSTHKKKH